MAKRRESADLVKVPYKKKELGQHFLRDQNVVDSMIDRVTVTSDTSVMEIGCGDGFLTRSILEKTPCKKLVCFEIDPEWCEFVRKSIKDERLELLYKNVLELNWEELACHKPLIMLANLPYQVSFPILFRIQQHKHLFEEGVVMLQEEVAQKVVATSGRSYSHVALFLQHHLEFELLDKIPPSSFSPPPKVDSRLVYFKPRKKTRKIEGEPKFWKFLKTCFARPRKTLRNNLKAVEFDVSNISNEILQKRSQQLKIDDFLAIWEGRLTHNEV